MTFHYGFTIFILILSFVGTFLFLNFIKNKKSKIFREPFDIRPRPAGYSLQLKTNDLFLDLMLWLFFMMILAIMPLLAHNDEFVAWALSGISIVAILFCISKLIHFYKLYERHNLGLKGEQLVGTTLDQISTDKIKVFHDYTANSKGRIFNIDHIVVAPTGIFTIETKTRSKSREAGGHEVIYQNDQLEYPSGYDRHGIKQSKRQTKFLIDKLTSSTGCEIEAKPILVLPGWMVKRRSNNITVLSTKELINHFKGPEVIDAKTRQQVCHQLEQVCVVE